MPVTLSEDDLSAIERSRPRTVPLAGVRVIDAGQIIAGPFGPTLFGDFGADVIKIEEPSLARRVPAPLWPWDARSSHATSVP